MSAFSMFLAVFLAVYFVHEIDGYKNARERHRIYCRKKALYYTYL